MEQSIETGKDKVKKICEILRKETIEPAVDEAQKILEEAHRKGEEIVEAAKTKAKKILEDTDEEIEKRQKVFRASINQGARQSIEWLKQEVELRFLNENLAERITESTSDPKILADMLTAIVEAVSDEGLDTEISAIIPSVIEPRQVNELIGKDILDKLKEKSVIIGPQKGGVEIKLHKEKLTIDMSDTALFDLMTRYVRKDFHQFFFSDK